MSTCPSTNRAGFDCIVGVCLKRSRNFPNCHHQWVLTAPKKGDLEDRAGKTRYFQNIQCLCSVAAQVLRSTMAWRRVGGFWGYGDPKPRLVVVTDSITIVAGPRGRGDATPIVQWMLSMQVSSAFVISYAGARVLSGDYLRIVEAAVSLGAQHMIIVSMGNDVTDGATAETITEGLRCVLRRFPAARVVYGASGAVWGYANEAYDDTVRKVCSTLGCTSGARELYGARTSDSIGHFHVEAVPRLCDAIGQWCLSAATARSKL